MALQQPQDIKRALIDKARSVLNGQFFERGVINNLLKELEKWDQFGYASEILKGRIETDEKDGKDVPLGMQHTLVKYIYKDQSLPSTFKFDKALKVLESHDNLAKSDRCETLGFAGAIYKRMWQYDHQFRNLILSRHYYKRGFDIWEKFLAESKLPAPLSTNSEQNDMGYTAINYAYVCELMAVDKLEEHGRVTGITVDIEANFQEAERVRLEIVKRLTDFEVTRQFKQNVNKWIYPTIAEAYFGLRMYDQAAVYIQKYLDSSQNPGKTEEPESADQKTERIAWEVRTFRQQLLSISYLQVFQKECFADQSKIPNLDNAKYQPVSASIREEKINNCLNIFRKPGATQHNRPVKNDGKVGLALSGGGFRASLFHIGVLAALAEEDRLKDIEVLSCVSGGSIIGAYYYLKLKKLLERTVDEEIVKQDYIDFVKEIEKDFLTGVQKNLRILILTDPWKNLQMLFRKTYSRTQRIGELYDEYLFNDLVFGDQSSATKSKRRIFMDELRINPKNPDSETFNLAIDNWDRINKVPQLVLNSTCLNTGHNWQFTASWMGEPPGAIQTEIDVKPRLRRMYYQDAPPDYRRFPLGVAVGASSCVPVLFPPLLLKGLYPGIDVQLVDGGLHDNQGIGALIEQECSNMIISDASGQMPTTTGATNGMAGVFYRADTIIQERVRELQFKDIEERNHTTQIRDLIKIHLKDGLQSKPVNWKYCSDPARKLMYDATDEDESKRTKYGILVSVQRALSEIRTDLDSFNDTEAYGLMYSGYKQTKYKLALDPYWPEQKESEPVEWDFLKVEKLMTDSEEAAKALVKLKLGKNVFFKAFTLLGFDKIKKPLLILLMVLGFGFGGYALMVQNNISFECIECIVGVGFIVPAMCFIAFTILYWLYVGVLASAYNKYGKVKD
jgi:predicted acylesterase/phospholipase RssA